MTVLTGIDGRNPCGFLAALGALRLLTDGLADSTRLGWIANDTGGWHPVLTGTSDLSDDALPQLVLDAHLQRDLDAEFGWEKDLMKVPVEDARRMMRALLESSTTHRAAATVAACVLDVPRRQAGKPRPDRLAGYTQLRLIPRVGRARFLSTLLGISRDLDERTLRAALFGPWRYVKANSLRWDPGAALPLRAYSAEAPTNFGPLGVSGAVALAGAGLCFFPLVPARGGRVTRGFAGPRGSRFRWPIWESPLDEYGVRATLALPTLHCMEPDAPSVLARHGVVARATSRLQPVGNDGSMLLTWGEIDAVTTA